MNIIVNIQSQTYGVLMNNFKIISQIKFYDIVLKKFDTILIGL